MDKDVSKILRKNTLRSTDIRRRVLHAFTSHNYALSQSEIEQFLDGEVDRVTLYRTLRTFEEKGIVHVAYDGQSETKYALCHDDCGEGAHEDEHLHFYCTDCNKTICLEHIQLPSVDLPDGYNGQHTYFFVQGICKDCSAVA